MRRAVYQTPEERAKELVEFFWPLRRFPGEREVVKANIRDLRKIKAQKRTETP